MINNDDFVKMAEQLSNQGKHIQEQGNIVYENVKYVSEMARDVEQNKKRTEEVADMNYEIAEVMVDMFNEYRQHDELTMAQTKELQENQNRLCSSITQALFPYLEVPDTRRKGTEYYKQWIKVNKGVWSIFKHNVNGSKVPYDRTAKIKYEQALNYLKSLSIADYLAYRDGRWSDIKKFHFDDSLADDKISLEKLLEKRKKLANTFSYTSAF